MNSNNFFNFKNFYVEIPQGKSLDEETLEAILGHYNHAYTVSFLVEETGHNYAVSVYDGKVAFVIVPDGYIAETLTANTICNGGDFFYNAAFGITYEVPQHIAANEKFGYFPNCTIYFRKSANAESPKSNWKNAPVFNDFIQKFKVEEFGKPQPKKEEKKAMRNINGFYWFDYLNAYVQVPERFTVVSNARDYSKNSYFLSPGTNSFWRTMSNDYDDTCFYVNFYGSGKPKAPKYTKAVQHGEDTYYFVIPEGYEAVYSHLGTMPEKGDIYFNPYAGTFYTIEYPTIAGVYTESEIVVFRKKVEVEKPKTPKDTYNFKIKKTEDIDFGRILRENPEKNIFLVQAKGMVRVIVRNSFSKKFENADKLLLVSTYLSDTWGFGKDNGYRSSEWMKADKETLDKLKEQIKAINGYERSHNVKVEVF